MQVRFAHHPSAMAFRSTPRTISEGMASRFCPDQGVSPKVRSAGLAPLTKGKFGDLGPELNRPCGAFQGSWLIAHPPGRDH